MSVEEAVPGNRYVVGFMIGREDQRVVMIRKNRPSWQAGFLNGPGGKIELGETPREAMAREFEEETGFPTTPEAWETFFYLQSDHGTNLYFMAFPVQRIDPLWVSTQTDEAVVIRGLHRIDGEFLPNMSYILPMAWYHASYQKLNLSGEEGPKR